MINQNYRILCELLSIDGTRKKKFTMNSSVFRINQNICKISYENQMYKENCDVRKLNEYSMRKIRKSFISSK